MSTLKLGKEPTKIGFSLNYAETVSLEIPGALINGKTALRDQFVRPFVAEFDPVHRQITAARIYFDVATLLKQISSHQPAGATESSDIVIRRTHLSKGADRSVIASRSPGLTDTKV